MKIKVKKKEKKELRIKSPIQVFETERVKDIVKNLKDKIDVLEEQIDTLKTFDKIADEKLRTWVRKHDELLVKYKELLNKK